MGTWSFFCCWRQEKGLTMKSRIEISRWQQAKSIPTTRWFRKPVSQKIAMVWLITWDTYFRHRFGGRGEWGWLKYVPQRGHKIKEEEKIGLFDILCIIVSELTAGVNVKTVLTSFNAAFLPISRSRFKQRWRLVFTSDGVVVGSSENCIVGVASRSRRINQWQCSIPDFAIGWFFCFCFRLRQA